MSVIIDIFNAIKGFILELLKPLTYLVKKPPDEIFKFLRNIFISTALLAVGYNLAININGILSLAGFTIIIFSGYLYIWNAIYFFFHSKTEKEEKERKNRRPLHKFLHFIIVDVVLYFPIFLSVLSLWIVILLGVTEKEIVRIKNEGLVLKEIGNFEEGIDELIKRFSYKVKIEE